MRGAWALAAGLLLAACSVEVEGARCDVPWAPGQCPDGQACGNDRTCTERAAACAPAACCPPGTEGCTATPDRCGATEVLRCEDGDRICGTWAPVETCATGLVCGTVLDAPVCVCPAAGAVVLADAAGGSAAGATPAPTGAGGTAPASCRFLRLADALDAAAARAADKVVEAAGTFALSAEPRALAVWPGVTLRAAAGASPVLEMAAAVPAALAVAEGATVQDLTVRSVDAASAGAGVHVACADEALVTLARVRVEHDVGAGRLDAGFLITAPCEVSAEAISAEGAVVGLLVAEAGLPVDRADVVATGGGFTGNERGVELRAGRLSLADTQIADNLEEGLLAVGMGPRELTLSNVQVKRNGDSGLVLQSNQLLDLRGSTICANQAATARGALVPRLVGGVAFMGNPPEEGKLLFRGNAVFGNLGGDQLLVADAAIEWNLDGGGAGAGCTAGRNIVARYPAPPTSARGLFASKANVSASYNAWEGVTPTLGLDYEATAGNTVGFGAGGPFFCGLPDPFPTCD